MPKPTIEEIQEQADSNGGWCTKCEAWTHGAEQLLFMGLVDEDD